jgi:hypothetical protein
LCKLAELTVASTTTIERTSMRFTRSEMSSSRVKVESSETAVPTHAAPMAPAVKPVATVLNLLEKAAP